MRPSTTSTSNVLEAECGTVRHAWHILGCAGRSRRSRAHDGMSRLRQSGSHVSPAKTIARMWSINNASYEEVKEGNPNEMVGDGHDVNNISNGRRDGRGRRSKHTYFIFALALLAVTGVSVGVYFIIKSTNTTSASSSVPESNASSNVGSDGGHSSTISPPNEVFATNSTHSEVKQRIYPPDTSFGNISVICSVPYITASSDECLSACTASKCCQTTAMDSCLSANLETCKLYSPCNFLEQEQNSDYFKSGKGTNTTTSDSEMQTPIQGESITFRSNEDDSARRSKLVAQFKAISDGPSPKHWFPVPSTDDYPNGDQSYQVVDENGRNFTIRPIFYEAMPYKNRSTAVFAWIGLPSDDVVLMEKVPAMVLVHGGGGKRIKNSF